MKINTRINLNKIKKMFEYEIIINNAIISYNSSLTIK